MGNQLRTIRRIGLTWLATLSLAITVQAQTAEQLRQLENLTPAQRAAILEALDGEQQTSDPPLESPEVVGPRVINQKPYVSTATEEGRGISGISGLEAPAEAEVAGPELKPFGYDLFAGEPTTFAPATDIPIPVDYVIGPGDTIEVQLFGSENAQYNLVVTREGMLNFPELGPISVVGLTFSDLRQSIQQRVSEQMLGVSASISMGPLRSIRIFLLGDVYRPGSFTVSSLSTTTNALFVGGGINEIGSLRNVQLRRNGNLVSTLDLYDLLLRGDTSGDARLQPGDVIFIPPVGKRVGVDGEVRRPAIYELKSEHQVADVLELAGGILATAYPKASQIERINADRERTVIDVDLTSATGLSMPVNANDTIRIYSVAEKREDIVFLVGHVIRSGAFQWRTGMR
ncbi:MAG: SLBB domain-containing protein, partial [Gammaproteobacteria bacterium]|nr:SLBB domain-containing protein [Gammaproteobacteria bacterium]